jgi:hypothetical protein
MRRRTLLKSAALLAGSAGAYGVFEPPASAQAPKQGQPILIPPGSPSRT